MRLDLRLPLGLLFSIFGIILIAQGLLASPAANAKSLGLNVNLYWGLAQLAFGAVMLIFALVSRKRGHT
jgi:hypothetical protein